MADDNLPAAVRLGTTETGERTMDPKIVIIIVVSYLYGFFEVFMNLRQRSKSKVATSSDKGSLWLLYGLITVGYALSFSIGATTIGRIYYWNTLFAIGMALVVIGFVIRIHSILTLKQYFTYSVAKVEGHRLVETGSVQIYQTSWISWTTDHFHWDFDFDIELVINSGHDDPGHSWVSLPNKRRGKICA